MTRRSLVVLLALLFAVTTVQPAAADRHAPRGIPGVVPLSADADLAAWQRLQYGMFIHWGIYSELGGVWQGRPVTSGYSEQIQMWANIPEADYRDVASRFDPARFDPRTICALAKQAGMRYVVITSKHHDGFSMFDTATTTYDVVDATAYGKDPLKLLANECRRQGLGFGFYFSLVDWHQGHAFDGGNNNPIPASMEPVIEAQLRELMSNYGEIAEVWFDMSTPTAAQSARFAGIVRELQPHAAINSRIWNNAGDFRTLGDNEIPSVPLDGTWQTPASIYHETWGYRSWQVRDDLPGKVRDLVTGLTSVRARGGNYLLNIGPRGDGSVVGFEADVLRGMGDWLRRHPGAVLGARATRFGGQPWGEVTVNGRDLFLHVTHWPAAGELRLPGLATEVREVREDGANRLRWRTSGDDLVVRLPSTPHDAVLPVVRVRLGGELRIIPPRTTSDGPLDFEQGYSYADEGGYPSTHRTTVRQTAYVTGTGGRSYVVLRGAFDPATRYRVSVGDRSTVVTGADMAAVGPFAIPARQVTPVTITLASPSHQGEELGVTLSAAVVAEANAVTGWVEAPRQVELGGPAELPVHATNLTARPVSGRVGDVPFTNLAPGATFTATVPFTLPTSPGPFSLRAPVRSGARTVNLHADIDVVLPNVARGKQASQVSTAWGGVPERAVDGGTAGDYLRDNTASHTAEPSNQAWWQVDLGQPYRLAQLEIWNRSDCCADRLSNYWVLISDAPLTTDSLQDALATPGVTALHETATAGRPTVLDLDDVQGRHVRIQLESATDPLSLTEVVVRARV